MSNIFSKMINKKKIKNDVSLKIMALVVNMLSRYVQKAGIKKLK